MVVLKFIFYNITDFIVFLIKLMQHMVQMQTVSIRYFFQKTLPSLNFWMVVYLLGK